MTTLTQVLTDSRESLAMAVQAHKTIDTTHYHKLYGIQSNIKSQFLIFVVITASETSESGVRLV